MSSDKARARLDAMFALAPVVPVITIDHVDDAVPLARALISGGLRVVEITLRTDAALAAAQAILSAVPDAVVGLGTVVTPRDMESAARIGAAFALTYQADDRTLTAHLSFAERTLDFPATPDAA